MKIRVEIVADCAQLPDGHEWKDDLYELADVLADEVATLLVDAGARVRLDTAVDIT